MEAIKSHDHRHVFYRNVRIEQWTDWVWQQKFAIRTLKDLVQLYPGLSQERQTGLAEYLQRFRFQLTPYLISQFKCESGLPTLSDPIARQFFPDAALLPSDAADAFHGYHENWEHSEEFPTQLLHHKYAYKALLDVTDTCLAYCSYCFKVARTLDMEKEKNGFNKSGEWQNTLVYLRDHPEINEVILSGGDPMILSNSKLAQVLKALREIESIKIIRIHTRCLSHNPFRFDEEFITLCKTHDVTAIVFHVACTEEITPEFKAAVALFDRYGYGSILKCAQIPFLHDVNDSTEKLRQLLLLLVQIKIIPIHLFHAMPFTPGVNLFRPKVEKGRKILSEIRRHDSSLIIPMYEIVHQTGKYEIPIDGTTESDSNSLHYGDLDGHPTVEFTNYLGKKVIYLDGCA